MTGSPRSSSYPAWLNLFNFVHLLLIPSPLVDLLWPRIIEMIRNYGYKKLSDLVKGHTELFVVDERKAGNNDARMLYIRLRPKQKKSK
jgi:hypothetical protein